MPTKGPCVMIPRIRSFRGWLHSWSITENPWDLALVFVGLKKRATLRGRGPLSGENFPIREDQFGEFPNAFLRTVLSSHGAVIQRISADQYFLTLPNGLGLFAQADMLSLVEIYVNDAYKVESLDLAGQTCIDVGAYIGDSALQMALRGSKVFAFEPSEDCFVLARRNVEINNMGDRIVLLNYAADTDSMNELIRAHHLDKIALVKMDCEGCEFSIFSAPDLSWLEPVQRIAMEYHANPSSVMRLLREHGFSVKRRGNLRGGYLWAARD